MPDPSSTNLSDFDVKRLDFAHPLFSKYKLGKRLQILRRDVETGELASAQAISLVAGNTDSSVHTLLAPGSTAGTYDSTITSRLIIVTTDGANDYTVTLPVLAAEATKFTGLLHIVHPSGTGDLTISGAGGTDNVMDETAPSMQTFFSDGTDWYAGTVDEALTDDTA
jgi:hypothetical protein